MSGIKKLAGPSGRIMVRLTETQLARLSKIAHHAQKRKGYRVGMSDLCRDAVEQYLNRRDICKISDEE